jgi:hypothetical protein
LSKEEIIIWRKRMPQGGKDAINIKYTIQVREHQKSEDVMFNNENILYLQCKIEKLLVPY